MAGARAVDCCACSDARRGPETMYYQHYIDSGRSGRYAPKWIGYCMVCKYAAFQRNPSFLNDLAEKLGCE
jgi:hypothetical protein